MIPFLVATLVIVGSPGPATISAAGVAKGFGFWHGFWYQLGLITGGSATHVILWLFVSGGIFTTLHLIAPPMVLEIVKLILGLIATLLLLWISWKIGTANDELSVHAAQRAPGFFQGVALNLVNPKVYVGMYALYYNAGFDFGWSSTLIEFAFKFIIIVSFAFVSHVGWVWLGAQLSSIRMSSTNTRRMNAAFGMALVSVTLWAFWLMIKDYL